MLVSVFSDAGISTHKKISAWGAWVKSERGKAVGGGRFKEFHGCTATAEAMAAINAVYLAVSEGIAQSGDIILIQTDNIAVEAVLRGKKAKNSRKFDKEREKAFNSFEKIIAKNSLKWIWRHVKGHSGNGTPRTAVNEICDKICREYMEIKT